DQKRREALRVETEKAKRIVASSKPRSEQIAEAVERVIPRFAVLMPLRRKRRKELLGLGLSSNEVEALHMPGTRTAKTAARWFVSLEMDIPFDTVAQYHQKETKKHFHA